MLEILREHEALFLFAGILVVGLPALLPSIHLALKGAIDPFALIVLALGAMLVSDLVWHLVGRLVPRESLARRGPLAGTMRRVDTLLERHREAPTRVLFLSRFLYGSRIAAEILSGFVRMPFGKVVVVNVASSALWLAFLFGVTFAVGSSLESVAGGPRSMTIVLTALVLLAFGIRLGVRRLGRARRDADPAAERRSVSVVIPAKNEEAYLERAIRSVRNQGVPAEVVVVENGSSDGTAALARRFADVLVQSADPLGFSRARNRGARAATGDVLVFLDADSHMGPGALADVRRAGAPDRFGTVLGRPDPPKLRYRLFLGFKNLWHRLGLYRGVLGGLSFCDAALFDRIGGYDEGMRIDELHDFSRRARRAGGRYVLLTDAFSTTSMRRFESTGLWESFLFWCRLRFRMHRGGGFHRWVDAYPSFRERSHGAGRVHGTQVDPVAKPGTRGLR